MKAIMVMFDSLNRHMLPNYGGDWVKAPNFERLGKKTITFDQCYAGSLPCMPARRELHTGRYNFLHRSWGPIEPFDDSMPELLKNNGIYTHLTSDHQHYWEDGGCTYHTRYSSWEISRGQEGDPWKGILGFEKNVETPFIMMQLMQKRYGMNMLKQDNVNRMYLKDEKDMPQAITFKNGLEFIEMNHAEDSWFLQIETFDPHEPFFAPKRFQELYPDEDYKGMEFDWPPYAPVMEGDDVVGHGKKQYAALLSMCDHYLGKVLDMMDQHNMWKDTMLIVNTDHGYLLGEHGWWSKSVMPTYNEIAHIPLFVWDPRSSKQNEHRDVLVQTIDVAPTLLDFFGVEIPRTMEGKPLKETIQSNKKIREAAMFGYHGGHVNVTDGKYVYMRGPIHKSNKPLYEYTLMPTHMRKMFGHNELQNIDLDKSFAFTQGCPVMKIEVSEQGFINPAQFGSKLFDLTESPNQEMELTNLELEMKMIEIIRGKMLKNEAPSEQFERLGIHLERPLTREELIKQKEEIKIEERISGLEGFEYEPGAFNQLVTVLNLIREKERDKLLEILKEQDENAKEYIIKKEAITNLVQTLSLEEEEKEMIRYFVFVAGRTN